MVDACTSSSAINKNCTYIQVIFILRHDSFYVKPKSIHIDRIKVFHLERQRTRLVNTLLDGQQEVEVISRNDNVNEILKQLIL